jgi:hypothetical protein
MESWLVHLSGVLESVVPRRERYSLNKLLEKFINVATPLVVGFNQLLELFQEVDSESVQSHKVVYLPVNGYQGVARRYQRGSRNPRPPDPLAFWRRYSASVASARFSCEIDFCSLAILMAAWNETSI